MKRILTFVLLLVVSLYAVGQDYDLYLQEAFKHLEKGNKEDAEKCYGVYKKMTNKTDVHFESLLLKFREKDEWQKSCHIIDLGDGYTLAVQKKAGDDLRQFEAHEKALGNRLGGFNDWRLPTKEELQIIVANLTVSSWKGKYYWTNTEEVSKLKIKQHYGKYDKSDHFFYQINFLGEVRLRIDNRHNCTSFLVIRKYKTF